MASCPCSPALGAKLDKELMSSRARGRLWSCRHRRMVSRSLIQPARTLADLVIAPRAGGCREGVSLHLERFGVRRDQPRASDRHWAAHCMGGPARAPSPLWPPSRKPGGRLPCSASRRRRRSLLAREESEEVRLRDTDTFGNRLGRGAVVALERELGDRSAGMTLSRLSCLLIRPVPPCRRAPVSST